MNGETAKLDCRVYGELISAYLDDELSAAELVRLAAHLKRCPSCNRFMDELMSVKGDLHRAEPFWARSMPGEGFVPALLGRLREEDARAPGARIRRNLPGVPRPPARLASWAAATAVTLLLALGVVSFMFRPPQTRVASPSAVGPSATPFLMARNTVEEDEEAYLRDHAIVSARNLLLDDEIAVEPVDYALP